MSDTNRLFSRQRQLIQVWLSMPEDLQDDITLEMVKGYNRIVAYRDGPLDRKALAIEDGDVVFWPAAEFSTLMDAAWEAHEESLRVNQLPAHSYAFFPDIFDEARTAVVRAMENKIAAEVAACNPLVAIQARCTANTDAQFLSSPDLGGATRDVITTLYEQYKQQKFPDELSMFALRRVMDARDSTEAAEALGLKIRNAAIDGGYAFSARKDFAEKYILICHDIYGKGATKALLITHLDDDTDPVEAFVMDRHGMESTLTLSFAGATIVGVLDTSCIELDEDVPLQIVVEPRKFADSEVLDVPDGDQPDVYGVYITCNTYVADFKSEILAGRYRDLLQDILEKTDELTFPVRPIIENPIGDTMKMLGEIEDALRTGVLPNRPAQAVEFAGEETVPENKRASSTSHFQQGDF